MMLLVGFQDFLILFPIHCGIFGQKIENEVCHTPQSWKSIPKPLRCRGSSLSCCILALVPAGPLCPPHIALGGPDAIDGWLIWAHDLWPVFGNKLFVGLSKFDPVSLQFLHQKWFSRHPFDSTGSDTSEGCAGLSTWRPRANSPCLFATRLWSSLGILSLAFQFTCQGFVHFSIRTRELFAQWRDELEKVLGLRHQAVDQRSPQPPIILW